MPAEKDIHYLITRIINPSLNWVIAELEERDTSRVVYGRDGYTGAKWRDYSKWRSLAERLERWRNGLWYRYNPKALDETAAKEILESFGAFLVEVEVISPEDNVSEPLWNLFRRIVEYLDVGEYGAELENELRREIDERRKALEKSMEPEKVSTREEEEAKVARVTEATKEHEAQGMQPIREGRLYAGFNVVIRVRKTGEESLGGFFIENGWCELYLADSQTAALVPLSRVQFRREEGKYVVEVDKITKNDIDNWRMWPNKHWKVPQEHKSESKPKRSGWFKKFFKIGVVLLISFLVVGAVTGHFGNVPGVSQVKNYFQGSPYASSNQSYSQETPYLLPDQTYSQGSSHAQADSCLAGNYYSLTDAIKCYLSDPHETAFLENIARKIRGGDLAESAWNIVVWEDKNIRYDWDRARMTSVPVQSPSLTVSEGKGICSDYAVLTAGLLLAMNYSPVYVFDMNFSNSDVGHAAAAIKIDGKYFMIDQHPPIMDLGTYWKDWAYWRDQESNGTMKNLLISKAAIYKIEKTPQGLKVSLVGALSADDFKREDYAFTSVDVQDIVFDLQKEFLDNYPNLHLDRRIANLDRSEYVPSGYSAGRTWWTVFPHFGEYYSPAFHKEFVRYLYENSIDSPEIRSDLESYSYFWVKAEIEGDNSLRVVINLAK